MSAININGTQLEYMEQRTGVPVILVHGTLGDYRSWGLQMNVFSEKFRTISYSRRYHYPNECRGDEEHYSAALHADDLAGFMTGLGIESAHIVGNSYGAYTALFLAARHPGRVEALVLGEPPVFPLLDHLPEGRELRKQFLEDVWKPAGTILQQGNLEKGVEKFVDGVVEPGAFEQFPPEVRSLIMDNAREFKVETACPEFWTPFTCEDAKRVTKPTLLMSGANSLRMFQIIAEELERCLPDSELVILPESTHEMPADNPEAYNKTVLDFLIKYSA